jgi:hypothetical protein
VAKWNSRSAGLFPDKILKLSGIQGMLNILPFCRFVRRSFGDLDH